MRVDPTNNTLLNTRTAVFGAPESLYSMILQSLFVGYMLRFDAGTVEAQLYASIDENKHTNRLFNQALKELPVKYPEFLTLWSAYVK